MFIEVLLITLVGLQTFTQTANISYLKQLRSFTIFTSHQRNLISMIKYVEIKACIEHKPTSVKIK